MFGNLKIILMYDLFPLYNLHKKQKIWLMKKKTDVILKYERELINNKIVMI